MEQTKRKAFTLDSLLSLPAPVDNDNDHNNNGKDIVIHKKSKKNKKKIKEILSPQVKNAATATTTNTISIAPKPKPKSIYHGEKGDKSKYNNNEQQTILKQNQDNKTGSDIIYSNPLTSSNNSNNDAMMIIDNEGNQDKLKMESLNQFTLKYRTTNKASTNDMKKEIEEEIEDRITMEITESEKKRKKRISDSSNSNSIASTSTTDILPILKRSKKNNNNNSIVNMVNNNNQQQQQLSKRKYEKQINSQEGRFCKYDKEGILDEVEDYFKKMDSIERSEQQQQQNQQQLANNIEINDEYGILEKSNIEFKGSSIKIKTNPLLLLDNSNNNNNTNNSTISESYITPMGDDIRVSIPFSKYETNNPFFDLLREEEEYRKTSYRDAITNSIVTERIKDTLDSYKYVTQPNSKYIPEKTTPDYCRSFMRRALGDKYGERECKKGQNCIFLLMAQHSPDTVEDGIIGGFIAKEFLLPSQLKIWQEQGKLPARRRLCIGDNRLLCTYRFKEKEEKNEDSLEILQDHCNTIDTEGKCDGSGYSIENCLTPVANRNQKSGARVTGIVEPIVMFNACDYTYSTMEINDPEAPGQLIQIECAIERPLNF